MSGLVSARPAASSLFFWLPGLALPQLRRGYGTVFKTRLLGRPVIRVSGAENVRTVLLGEHRLVRWQWPQSAHILLGSHTLLGAVGESHRQRRRWKPKTKRPSGGRTRGF